MGFLSEIARLGPARCGGQNAGMDINQGEGSKRPTTTRRRPVASKTLMAMAVISTPPARSTPIHAGTAEGLRASVGNLAANGASPMAASSLRLDTEAGAGSSRMTRPVRGLRIGRVVVRTFLRHCRHCVGSFKVVMEGLNGVHARVFHLSVAQFAHGAFRNSGPLSDCGQIGKTNGAQASEYGGKKCRLVHAPHFRPIFGLRQPANGPQAGA
ncbi:hypothetical protein D3C87_1177120 [compost metagenome]